MFRLILFELAKIWKKRSFILSVCVLLAVNLFLLWYVHLPDDATPPLSAYKAFQEDIASMSEEEKAGYITGLKEKMDGIRLVRDVRNMQAMGSDMGDELAQQKMDANPGVFEQYSDLYKNGDYLLYTDDLTLEGNFVDELYEEFVRVSGYENYLSEIQENKNGMMGISVFSQNDTDSFSSRNIAKSAADYEKLDHVKICWQSAKGITSAMENDITDILMFLGVMLFVGGLITEEKEKGLFFITRSTRRGITASMAGKLLALLVHCMAVAAFMICANLAFFAVTAGIGPLTVSIQSIAPYMESSLPISVWGYIVLSVFTKAMVLFVFGAVLAGTALCGGKSFSPYLTGIGLLVISELLYILVPASFAGNSCKYLNFAGLMKTGQLYGAYLNLNIGGHPISRLTLSWIAVSAAAVGAAAACLYCFCRGKHLVLKKTSGFRALPFRFHDSLLRHEAYKMLVMNRGIFILLCFVLLAGANDLSRQYHLSAQENYYQEMMLRLEGELNDRKEELVLSEKERFDEAEKKLEQIDAMTESGELDSAAGEAMKSEWEAVLAFYPVFSRIWQQYEQVSAEGGEFVYDTGYLYLFGMQDDSYLTELLLLSVCMVLAFYNSISMEYSRGTWFLLGTTKYGRKKIISRKVRICLICSSVMAVLPWIFRIISISSSFPMHGLQNPVQSIPAFSGWGIEMPIVCFAAFLLLSQILAVMIVSLVMIGISEWRKNDLQALFFGLLVLVIPLVLKWMGLDFAGWISVYPVYAWSTL